MNKFSNIRIISYNLIILLSNPVFIVVCRHFKSFIKSCSYNSRTTRTLICVNLTMQITMCLIN